MKIEKFPRGEERKENKANQINHRKQKKNKTFRPYEKNSHFLFFLLSFVA